MRGQAAFEYMVIAIFVLGFLTPLWLYVSRVNMQTNDNFILSHAKNAVSQIAKYADMVYAQRSNASVKIGIYIPSRVQYINFTQNLINFRVESSSGPVDVYEITMANVTGSLPTEEGFYWVMIKAEGPYVNITLA